SKAPGDFTYALRTMPSRRGECPRLDCVLHSDGRITELMVTDSSVSDALRRLCQSAVLDPTPYWDASRSRRGQPQAQSEIQLLSAIARGHVGSRFSVRYTSVSCWHKTLKGGIVTSQ